MGGKRKCRLASNSIAERYPVHGMHRIDSDKVLADQGYPPLPSGRSERTFMAIRAEHPTPKATPMENPMKTVFIALALIVATAAPSMAIEFNNHTVQGGFGR